MSGGEIVGVPGLEGDGNFLALELERFRVVWWCFEGDLNTDFGRVLKTMLVDNGI